MSGHASHSYCEPHRLLPKGALVPLIPAPSFPILSSFLPMAPSRAFLLSTFNDALLRAASLLYPLNSKGYLPFFRMACAFLTQVIPIKLHIVFYRADVYLLSREGQPFLTRLWRTIMREHDRHFDKACRRSPCPPAGNNRQSPFLETPPDNSARHPGRCARQVHAESQRCQLKCMETRWFHTAFPPLSSGYWHSMKRAVVLLATCRHSRRGQAYG